MLALYGVTNTSYNIPLCRGHANWWTYYFHFWYCEWSIKTLMCKSACAYALLFLYTVKRGMASSLANSCVPFEGASKLSANCAILYPNSNAWGTLGFHIFPTFIIACLFLLWPLVGMKCCLIVFLICIPQMTNAFEHFYVLYIFKIKVIHCRKLKISRKSKGKKSPRVSTI